MGSGPGSTGGSGGHTLLSSLSPRPLREAQTWPRPHLVFLPIFPSGVLTRKKHLRPRSPRPLSKLHQPHPRHPRKSFRSLKSAHRLPPKNQVTKDQAPLGRHSDSSWGTLRAPTSGLSPELLRSSPAAGASQLWAVLYMSESKGVRLPQIVLFLRCRRDGDLQVGCLHTCV